MDLSYSPEKLCNKLGLFRSCDLTLANKFYVLPTLKLGKLTELGALRTTCRNTKASATEQAKGWVPGWEQLDLPGGLGRALPVRPCFRGQELVIFLPLARYTLLNPTSVALTSTCQQASTHVAF